MDQGIMWYRVQNIAQSLKDLSSFLSLQQLYKSLHKYLLGHFIKHNFNKS